MHQSEILNTELERVRQRVGHDDLEILETGTIRGDTENYQQGDGWSTLTFARHAQQYGGKVTSVDLDTSTSARVLKSHGVAQYVNLVEGHSIAMLAGFANLSTGSVYDLILLDSDNDSKLIFHEYLIARHLLNPAGLILVDDVDLDSSGVVKGHDLVPWLDQVGVPYRVDRREGNGYATGVLVVDPWTV